MRMYLSVVIALSFLVNVLLLTGADRLCGGNGKKRTIPAAILGAVYGGSCLLPGLHFLGNMFWRIVFLILISVVAYGMNIHTLRRGSVFIILSMALGGLVTGLGGGVGTSVVSGVVLCCLCALGFRDRRDPNGYVPVELTHGDRIVKITALRDTGNTLHDPVTGKPVLVVDAQVAGELTGLSAAQLQNPVETMGELPGLRLIPYRSVGQENGLLLAMRLRNVKIGSWQGSAVVAFSPVILNMEGTYQALTGGMA